MPRVLHRKARKDYPDAGIVKGEMYYYCQMKTGPRSSRIIRQKEQIKPSQLTTSAFKQAFFAAQEEWEKSEKDGDAIRAACETIREAGEEARNSFDAMPDGLQQGDTGQLLENRADECDRIADELDTLAGELDDLEEPDDVDEPFDPADWAEEISTMDPEDAAEFLSEKEQEHDERISAAQEEHDHYQSELARIPEEADGLIGDMPE